MDRKSVVVLGLILGGLFLAVFGFLFLVVISMQSGGERPGLGGGAIGVVEIKGTIEDSDQVMKILRRFGHSKQIKALLVRIDSPGGAVAPSQEIYSELRRIGQTKQTVCSLGSTAASGGYYIAAGCNKILAEPGTLTGSIGVISQVPYLGALADELKFRMVTIKSGELKDVGNPFREMSAEDRAFFQQLMDSVHEQFIAAVAEGRGLEIEQVRPLADGRVLTGEQARQHKLIDEFGSFNDAVRLAAELAGIEGEPRLQYPPREHSFPFELLLESGGEALARGIVGGLRGEAGVGQQAAGPAYLAPLPGLLQ